MSRKAKRLFVLVAIGALLVALAVLGPPLVRARRYRTSRKHIPICTLCTAMAFEFYVVDDGPYPIADTSLDALSLMIDEGSANVTHFAKWESKDELEAHFREHGTLREDLVSFRYVQGLRANDPKDLVVAYVKHKSHWKTKKNWDPEERWVVMRPGCGGYWGREGGWLTATELCRDLGKTLAFLKAEQRPMWEQSAREHAEFLESLKSEE